MKIKRKIIIFCCLVLSLIAANVRAEDGKITVARAFYELAHQNNPQRIKSLLSRGYSIESPDQKGNTPICLAILRQDRVAYRNLISAGADKSPSCIKKIPENIYRRFFGQLPAQEFLSTASDTPYLIGAAGVGVAAVATAYILRGDIDKGSGDDSGGGGGGGDDDGDDKDKTCSHGVIDKDSGRCICNAGYKNFGDDYNCYEPIANCVEQEKDTCTSCNEEYILSLNACYGPIEHCSVQKENICEQCDNGYGIYGGNGTICFTDIPNCKVQETSTCAECISGYGTHGDNSACYKNIDHCLDQTQTACTQCEPGYDTYGDPTKSVCYNNNPCAQYANTVPVSKDGGFECQCNEDKGYSGTPGNCTQASEGDYQEGDGNKEVWNDLNEKYCHSHGTYNEDTQLCSCYRGYASPADGCAGCAEGYLDFNGLCYRDLSCELNGDHYVQSNDSCICEPGYFEYEGQCNAAIQCPLHQEQVRPGNDPAEVCACKLNFDENCETCIEGFEYDIMSDSCIQEEIECEGNWTGLQCDICPAPFVQTEDEAGNKYCFECAENRLPSSIDPTCSQCAEGYMLSPYENNCVKNECSTDTEGYVIRDGFCTCDTDNGYVSSLTGTCVKKGPDLIGLSDSNINNRVITVYNEGTAEGVRDVYGMKPVLSDDGEGNIEYFDDVYNALAQAGSAHGTINITNINAGANTIYGIYAPSTLYNAAAISDNANTSATGTINITDNTITSDIYGMFGVGDDNIYNAFARNSIEASGSSPANSVADGAINITKEKDSYGTLIGIKGHGNIYNAYANTQNGIAANTKATGNISITNLGQGNVFGIFGENTSKKINNSLSFLDSAISDAVSSGTIIVEGKKDVYGIYSNGTIVNSETQFDKSYNKVNDFRSTGNIYAKTKTGGGTAYGIYLYNTGNPNVEVYNALGYMSTGNIEVSNEKGGSAYGIWNEVMTHIEEDGLPYYNNTYNAFRSSAKYGGKDTEAKGTIRVNISDSSNGTHTAEGIYAAGNVFNAYANSGSEVELASIGKILIEDTGNTSGIRIRGIESGGATIANAYSTGQNKNTSTSVKGDIDIKVYGNKSGSDGSAVGIYSDEPSTMTAKIYNAALINDKSNVEGNIRITSVGSAALSNIYGIYASKYIENGHGNGNEGHEKIVYNAYYNNSDATEYIGSVKGNITINVPQSASTSDANYFGIYMTEGTAYNAYSTNSNANVSGDITINVGGGQYSGMAAGMYGKKSSLYNTGSGSKITVQAQRVNNDAYGLMGVDSYLENSGNINVSSAESNAYGLYLTRGQAVNAAKGIISASGKIGSYGIYVIADGTPTGGAQAINLGTINLSGEGKNIGIYASGANATVQNEGRIIIKGTEADNVCEGENCTNAAIQLVDGATLNNSGKISSSGHLNLAAMGGNIVLEQGGRFEAADSISGNIQVSANTVKNSFDNTVILENAVASENIEDLNIGSKSYLYNTALVAQGENQYNVEMQRKNFSEVAYDKSEEEYLEQNYKNKKNLALFNAIKTASTLEELREVQNKTAGRDMLPNITQEELKVQRSLDRTMVNELFKEGNEVRKMVGADVIHGGRGDHGALTGYDLDSQSTYALYDKRIENNYRLGLGLSFTHTDTDYNNASKRKNFMVQGYVPLTYSNNNGITAVSMARLGYADGDYTRKGYNTSYKADTKAITYGLLNELRYTQKLAGVKLTPFIGMNAIGWYQDSISEGNADMALHLASSHTFSLESALGLYVDKDIEFDQDSKLNIALGLGYYHEFADPYRGIKAHHTDSIMNYKLKNRINSRDRGILSAKVNYDYKDFSLYGQILQYLETEHPLEIEGGIKYRF